MTGFSRGFLAFYCAFLASLAVADSLPETIDKIRPSIVAVGTHAPTHRPPAQFRGTGFVVGDGRLVVTNHHVVPALLNTDHFESLAVFSGRGQQVRMHRAKVLASDSEHDLAVLRIEGEPLPALTMSGQSRVREGQSIALTGFPIGMVLGLYPVTHQGIIAAITPLVIPAASAQQLTAKAVRAMDRPFDVYQLDATAYPGNSGSPVYDPETGQVLGVINMVLVRATKESALSDPTGISYAIPSAYVMNLLKQPGVQIPDEVSLSNRSAK